LNTMEDWQAETLVYLWKKMKIEKCIAKEYYDPYDGHINRSYEFPNGLFIECIFEKEGISYATMKFKADKQTTDLILSALENRDVSSKELDQISEFILDVFSQGEMMEILWNLFHLDFAQYAPAGELREYKLECPHCKVLISFESARDNIWLKCRNCANEIFIGGSRYSEVGN